MAHLEFRNIGKQFNQVNALVDVSLNVSRGSVHALMGENGSGKSTLLKILGGDYIPDQGAVYLDGVVQNFHTPRDAIAAGIAVIHQELQYVLDTTVGENLLLGHLPTKMGFVQWRRANEEMRHKLKSMGVDLDPRTPMRKLSIGERQMVEICKAMLRDASVFALDEPTSSLSIRETEVLFKLVGELHQQGKAVLYVSHRMNEIYRLCDACSVLRDGHLVQSFPQVSQVTHDDLIKSMVGRNINDIFNWQPRERGPVCLEVRGLQGMGMRHPLDLSIHRGEIVGIFGLVGAGRSEFMKVLSGAMPRQCGEIFLDGRPAAWPSVQSAIAQGIVLCPEDRKEEGIITGTSVGENINVSTRRHFLRFKMFLDKAREKELADRYIASMKVKTYGRQQIIQFLSGGNQQKVILARWLAEQGLNVLLMDEPTRGIDIGAKHEIYNIMYAQAAKGCAVIMVSSELPEVLGVSDRILVMRDGLITGALDRAQASEAAVMRLALPDMTNTTARQFFASSAPAPA